MNTTCLSGMQCPKCQSYEPFRIEVLMTVLMFDMDGSKEDPEGDTSGWDNKSWCQCVECLHSGTVAAFQTAEKAQ